MKFAPALIAIAVGLSATAAGAQYAAENWSAYHGDRTASHYSQLTQINRQNVAQLELAWTFHSPGGDGSIQCNPLVVDGVLYGTANAYFFAVDAATGRELWRFDAHNGGRRRGGGRIRGMAWWSDGKESRLLVSNSGLLYALDPASGQPIKSFGNGGAIDLRQGIDRDPETFRFSLATPGVIYEDLYIIGSNISEDLGAPPGDIQAYNVRTGELAWVFHTIPHPGELGYDTWPKDAWKFHGGANAWAGLSLDVERGMVFVPTGSGVSDFYGASRLGKNLFANSIIALDAATGKRIWHYQTVHHDLWDRDLPAQPNLMTIQRHGRSVDVVAQVTKSGHIFVLDRETGEPIFPVEEVAVPTSVLAGDAAWPTQPVPTKPPPFTRVGMTADDITDLSPEAHAYVSQRFAGLRNEGVFTSVSEQETLLAPGTTGGAEWGGAAHDPRSGMLYINANDLPFTFQLVKVLEGDDLTPYQQGRNTYAERCSSCHGIDRSGGTHMSLVPPLTNLRLRMQESDLRKIVEEGKGRMPGQPWLLRREGRFENLAAFLFDIGADEDTESESASYTYAHTGYNNFVDHEGYPAIKPPWGTLNAIDLNEGTIKWQVPLGEFAELTARGIPQTGTENWGGPVLTATGLIFIAASADDKIRAFDQETGEVLVGSKATRRRLRNPQRLFRQRQAVYRHRLRRRSGAEYRQGGVGRVRRLCAARVAAKLRACAGNGQTRALPRISSMFWKTIRQRNVCE